MDYRSPEETAEVLALLEEYGSDATVIAGGTAAVLMLKQRLLAPEVLVSIDQLRGLDTVVCGHEMLSLGACVTHRQAEHDAQLRARLPALADTFHHVATPRIRNAATVGGMLAHADPNQDPPVTLTALDARIELASARGTREVPIDGFFTDYYETLCEPEELITGVRIPLPSGRTSVCYLKFLPRSAEDFGTVTAAVRIDVDPETNTCSDSRVVLGCVGSTVLRAREAETVLRGQQKSDALLREAAAAARVCTDPLDDTRGSAEYKRDMAAVFVRRAAEQAWQQALSSESV